MTVCVMNAGYSSGWCEESFAMPLVAAEVECQGRGDAHCRFIMAPPDTIEIHLARYFASHQRACLHPTPAPTAISPSRVFHAMVKYSSRRPCRASRGRSSAIASSPPMRPF